MATVSIFIFFIFGRALGAMEIQNSLDLRVEFGCGYEITQVFTYITSHLIENVYMEMDTKN